MEFFYVVVGAMVILLGVNFFMNFQEKDFITKKKKDKSQSFAELLNYTALVDSGVVLTSEGTLIAGYFFQGNDVQASTPDELESRSSIINETIKNLGENIVVQVDAIRTPATQYPSKDKRFFPDVITQRIDDIRRQIFQSGTHCETAYVFIVTYIPPLIRDKKLTDLMYDVSGNEVRENSFTRNLNTFKEKLFVIEQNLKSVLKLHRMQSSFIENEYGIVDHTDEVVNYINYCLTGHQTKIKIPAIPIHIASLLGVDNFEPGVIPVLGNQSIINVSVNGYPIESFPVILNALDKLPCEYRLSHRFMTLPREVAVGICKRQQRKWQQKIRGMRDQFNNTAKGPINMDAMEMTEDAGRAFSEIESGLVSYGMHSCTVTLMGDNREKLFENATTIQRILSEVGFTSCIEDINTTEAFLGSLPGNRLNNLRQVPISTLVLADILPTSSIWAGLKNCPHPEFPPNTPSLLYASTEGITPFRFNLHVSDVGHTLIFGPIGNGKSTLIGLINAQFRGFPKARVYAFDKGYSLYVLTKGVAGDHYDLARKSGEWKFSPLKEIDNPNDFQWAVDWISMLVALQLGRPTTPHETAYIVDAMKLLKKADLRSLTDYMILLQSTELRTCIEAYTGEGVLGEMLDNNEDNLSLSNWSVFEIEHLMRLEDRYLLPTLLYIFRKIENSLDGNPTIITIDEGWVALGNETFRDKLKEWLKVLRKRNCAVVFATQSVSDATNSGIIDVLDESCFTKIFLPNSSAKNENSAKHYKSLGLNDAELNIIAQSKPKRDYYIVQRGQGKRLINFNLDPYTLAFVGKAGEHIVKELDDFINLHPKNWRDLWPDA